MNGCLISFCDPEKKKQVATHVVSVSPGHILQTLRVPPGSAEAAISQRHQDADRDHARMTSLLFVHPDVDEGAQAGIATFVDKIDEVLGDGVQARGQALELDDALELDARDGLLPDDGVAGLDVEIDEEERGDGGQVRQQSRTVKWL